MSPFEYRIECPKCQNRQIARELAEYASDAPFGPEPTENRFAVAECAMCYHIMVLQQPLQLNKDFQEVYRSPIATVIWPVLERSLSSAIPEDIRREHTEARACFKANAYTATLVMVRRTLEGVCSGHGVTAKPLFKALADMQDKGLIEGRLLDWAQELRVLGNEAAHFTGKSVSRQDAQDALELAEALMDYLYVFTARFNEFKNRRSNPSEQDQTDN